MRHGERWGRWELRLNGQPALVRVDERNGGERYYIDLDRIHEAFWLEHVCRKVWARNDRADLAAALEAVRAAYPLKRTA